MSKVVIIGSTGMLGNAVGKFFLEETKHDVTLTYRNEKLAYGDSVFFDPMKMSIGDLYIDDFEYVINCIGIIKPFMKSDPIAARKINSIFPLELANWCQEHGKKLIHITTDCVFSGKDGKYTESSLHDALDDYGKSKSLGEPDNCMVIRTSIIGEEVHKFASLISWAKSMRGKTANGFINHFWNGITTKQYARACNHIIENNLYSNELFHVHASDDVNKFQMMQYFNEKWDLGIDVSTFLAKESCDRTLRSVKNINGIVACPSVRDMIMDL